MDIILEKRVKNFVLDYFKCLNENKLNNFDVLRVIYALIDTFQKSDLYASQDVFKVKYKFISEVDPDDIGIIQDFEKIIKVKQYLDTKVGDYEIDFVLNVLVNIINMFNKQLHVKLGYLEFSIIILKHDKAFKFNFDKIPCAKGINIIYKV